jgi:hypothetical protein
LVEIELPATTLLIIPPPVPHPIISPPDLPNMFKYKELSRRDDSDADTIKVPLNNASSSNQNLVSEFQIPYTSLVASSFAYGGGSGETINGGIFTGRKSGRGTRNEIYGSARYGSGYGTYSVVEGGKMEYTPDLTLNVSGRDFPHGFPPLAFRNYSGGDEYIGGQFSDYPGVTPSDLDGFNSVQKLLIAQKDSQVWFIVADGETVDVLSQVLRLPVSQGGCGSSPYGPEIVMEATGVASYSTAVSSDNYTGSYLPDGKAWAFPIPVYPWNVLQYYRGSSVALGSYVYNNTYAHDGNNNTDYWAMSQLNTTGVDLEYLNCLNTTIAAVVPIVNPDLIVHQRLNPGQISGIVIGAVAGVALILVAVWYFLRRRRQNRQTAALATTGSKSPRPSITKTSPRVSG